MKILLPSGLTLIASARRAPTGNYPRPGFKPFDIAFGVVNSPPWNLEFSYYLKSGQHVLYYYGPYPDEASALNDQNLLNATDLGLPIQPLGGYYFNGTVRGTCYDKEPIP